MEEKAKIIDLKTNFNNQTIATILFESRGIRSHLYSFLNKDIKINIKKFFKKRSTNANSYAWALITELANVLDMSKEEVYLLKLKDYGQSELVLISEDVNPKYFFKYYSEEGQTVVKGKKYKWYKVYKGTSEYDTREMSIFINGLIRDCEEQNIYTKPKKEVDKLLESWNKNVS